MLPSPASSVPDSSNGRWWSRAILVILQEAGDKNLAKGSKQAPATRYTRSMQNVDSRNNNPVCTLPMANTRVDDDVLVSAAHSSTDLTRQPIGLPG